MNSHNAIFEQLPTTLGLHCVRTGQSMDHDALTQAVYKRAQSIRAVNGDQVGQMVVAVTDPIDCLVILFAVWSLGACAVMVNPAIKEEEKQRVIAKTDAALWIGNDGIEQLYPKSIAQQYLKNAALILMTSGTTGDPKGVTHSQRTLLDRLTENVAVIGADNLQRTICTLPLFFGHGLIGNSLTTLFAGQQLYLWPSLGLQEMPQYGPTIDRIGATFFSSVPSFWRMILTVSAPPKMPPKRVHIGSAPLSQKLWQDVVGWCGTQAVYNTYGMTETANWISGGSLAQSDTKDGFVGQPWGGTFGVIRDGAVHAFGQGEIAVKSPGQMLGLWGDPTQSHALMFDGYMRTGDIGMLDVDQRLWLIGRSKHEINVGGIKVLAEEIDLLLERHPNVTEACGFGIPDPIAGERVAAVVKANDPTLTVQDLQDWCRESARADAVPARIAIVDDIPKNDRGKIARMDVKERIMEQWHSA